MPPFSPQENSIACVCLPEAQPGLLMRGGNDSMVKVWDIPSRTVLRSYGGHAGWIWCLEATDDSGHVLLSGATDMTLRLWDTRALGNSPELHNECAWAASRAVGRWPGSGRVSLPVLSGGTGSQRVPVTLPPPLPSRAVVRSSGPVAGLKVLPDQRRFVTGSFDRGVRIWDLRAMSVCSPCGRMTGPARGTQRSGSLGAPGCCDAESFIEVLFLRLHERSPTPQASSAASGSRALIGTLTGHQVRPPSVRLSVNSESLLGLSERFESAAASAGPPAGKQADPATQHRGHPPPPPDFSVPRRLDRSLPQDRTTRVDATVDSIYSASFDSTVKIWNFI